MSDDLNDAAIKIIEDMNESHIDIASAELLAFNERWSTTAAEIPVDFVYWEKIYLSVKAYSPEVLQPWNVKIVKNDELEAKLGVLSHLIDPFVDYVNTNKKTLIMQYINTLVSVGYLDVSFDSTGKEVYIERQDQYDYGNLQNFVTSLLKAKEDLIG